MRLGPAQTEKFRNRATGSGFGGAGIKGPFTPLGPFAMAAGVGISGNAFVNEERRRYGAQGAYGCAAYACSRCSFDAGRRGVRFRRPRTSEGRESDQGVDGARIQPCTAPNRTHGPPLAVPSCNPPVQHRATSRSASRRNNGAPANSEGFVKLDVTPGMPGPPEDSDVLIIADGTDIRCRPARPPAAARTPPPGADYTGQLEGNAQIRITDH